MRRQLQRTVWVVRVLTVALGLVVVAQLFSLPQQRGRGAGGDAEPPPGAERLRAEWRAATPPPDVVDAGEEDTEEEEQQVAFSLSRIARLLGWGGKEDADDTDVASEEDAGVDRIRVNDLRPLESLARSRGPTTEWADSVLLRAFVARYGGSPKATATAGWPATSDLDLDVVGEMKDFAGASTRESGSGTPARAAHVLGAATPLPPLPVCPPNGIITTQDEARDDDIGGKILEYCATWLVSRGVGRGWRAAVVPIAVLRHVSPLFGRLSLPAVEQLPSSCRPPARALEDAKSAALGDGELADVHTLPARFVDPATPLVVRSGVLLPRLVVGNLVALREELSLRGELLLAARAVLAVCLQRLRESSPQDRADGAAIPATAVSFIAVHARRRDTALWLRRKSHRKQQALAATYFRSAMDHFRSRLKGRGSTPLFVVSTDDPRWVRRTLPVGPDVCVTGTEHASSRPHPVDIAVLATCDHAVVDLSAAALVTAILVTGDVVAPKGLVSAEPGLAAMSNWTFL